MEEKNVLFIVVPCYNEEEVLPETNSRLLEKLHSLIDSGKVSDKSRILYVNDGSKDKTWSLIKECHANDEHASGLCLSRNRGHQNALLAGLLTAKDHADMIVSMDADLQDDINAVDEMIEKYEQGCDIVYGVRKARKKDTFFKRFTAEGFYKIMDACGAEVVFNSADYRLMSKRAIEGLEQYHEVNLFLRGIVPMIGYKSDIVFYERGERFAGESKYPLKKMLAFAYEGVTSLTFTPIHFFRNLGLAMTCLCFPLFLVFMILYFCSIAKDVMLLLTLIFLILGCANLLLLAVGIVGDYVGKTYMEVKARPRFIIAESLLEEKRK